MDRDCNPNTAGQLHQLLAAWCPAPAKRKPSRSESSWHGSLSGLAAVMITLALGAIGLSTDVKDLKQTGFKPLALGAILWFLVAGTSLGLQAVTGSL